MVRHNVEISLLCLYVFHRYVRISIIYPRVRVDRMRLRVFSKDQSSILIVLIIIFLFNFHDVAL